MALVKKVRPLGSRGGGGTAQRRSSARPEFVAKEAPCAHACPAGTDVRGFLVMLARGDARGLTETQAVEAAFHVIADRNPLPAVCGWLCPHHCETGCTREPVRRRRVGEPGRARRRRGGDPRLVGAAPD